MALDATFWSRYFKRECIPQVHALVEILERRLLPQFDRINEEADSKANEAWETFMRQPSDGSEDPSEFADAAFEEGLAHYQLMYGLRQGLVNMFAAALYHLFEQHVMVFHRKQVLHPAKENDVSLLTQAEFKKELRRVGVDVEGFAAWARIEELSLVANTVKHGDGRSAEVLWKRRPDLFEHRTTIAGLSWSPRRKPQVTTPISGDSIFVTLNDIRLYAEAVEGFWNDLFSNLQRS